LSFNPWLPTIELDRGQMQQSADESRDQRWLSSMIA